VSGSGVDEQGAWSPAFNGQREPFQPGNEAGFRHGSYVSPIRLQGRAQEIAEMVAATLPICEQSDLLMVSVLAMAAARAERAQEALDRVDDLASDPAGPYVADRGQRFERLRADLDRWISRISRLSEQLGLSPRDKVRLGIDVARAHAISEAAVHLERLSPEERQTLQQLLMKATDDDGV
jgi:hypothetical protein